MNNKEKIDRLYKMRFLENECDSIEQFEELLNDLSERGTIEDLPGLCKVFEDQVAEASTDDYLLETIFHIIHKQNTSDGMKSLVYGISHMLPQAEFWAEQIQKAILNSPKLLQVYKEVLLDAEKKNLDQIRELLLSIRESEPDKYSLQIDSILDGFKG
ncbi:Imm30 family immunity protein [Paenibacillus hunanensis]|uniref:Imm30 family immunity protein n=1 Tax=Paenibacillus hunanensis TaxID=539262 RepID=UPI002A6B41D5|nr:Imm30 family immunity protein [Paenibacillus hunanensis]WPP42977.1 Imm30 family immunity protein [Paenibacillus hunanensis]